MPSTLKGLWKQRVRWQRGLIQTARIHRSRFEQVPRRPVDAYLPLNLLSMLALPVAQLVGVALAVVASPSATCVSRESSASSCGPAWASRWP